MDTNEYFLSTYYLAVSKQKELTVKNNRESLSLEEVNILVR